LVRSTECSAQGLKSRTSFRSLTDGTSSKILIGQKHVRPSRWGIAQEDGAIYNGDHPGIFSRVGGADAPIAKSPTDVYRDNFGSSHEGTCNFTMANGSVRAISVLIATDDLEKLTARNDYEVVGEF